MSKMSNWVVITMAYRQTGHKELALIITFAWIYPKAVTEVVSHEWLCESLLPAFLAYTPSPAHKRLQGSSEHGPAVCYCLSWKSIFSSVLLPNGCEN